MFMIYRTGKSISFKRILKYAFLFLLVGGLLFYGGYSVVLNRKVVSLTPQQKKAVVIGHAGSAFFSPLNPFNPLPPNSRASLLKALANGAHGLEVDVQLSQDGVPILFHDENLEGMTTGKGLVSVYPATQLVQLTYTGGFFYDLFHDEKIIPLETLLQHFAAYPVKPDLHLDLRNYDNMPAAEYARTLMPLLRQYKYPPRNLWFVTDDEQLLAAFRILEPQAIFLLDMDRSYAESLKIVLANKLHGLVADGRYFTAAQMEEMRQHGLKVVLFGGKAKSTIHKMLLLQPDAIEVNNVKAMADMVR